MFNHEWPDRGEGKALLLRACPQQAQDDNFDPVIPCGKSTS